MHPNRPDGGRLNNYQFREHQIIDHQNDGMVVSTFAHPADWEARSEVLWNMSHTEVPAQVYATAYNPHGTECFEFLPMQAFFWLETDFGTVPIGQNAHGMVRMPPREAPDALANLVIPAFRRQCQNLRVTGVSQAQNIWALYKDPTPPNGQCVMARVEYEAQGQAFEEEFYGAYDWNQGMQFNWGFARLFCFRAARGLLEGAREKFWRVAGSVQPNPQWQQRHQQICQQLMAGFNVRISATYARFEEEKRRGIQNIRDNEQLLLQRSAQVEASVEQTRRQNEERSHPGFDRQQAFGDMLMNRTPYHDPNSSAGNYHYEPGDPKYVWTDGQGNFHPTEDPFEDPNHSRTGNWVRAERANHNG
jgi:hypothetical protein